MATSGIGGAIDVGSIVSQLMAVERQPLQALLTKQSAERLGLQVGQQVYAQIKAVALD